MNKILFHTTRSYAELHGLSVQQVQYHCRQGNLDWDALESAGHGTYLIPLGAKIKMKRVGRKLGYKVNQHQKKKK